MKTKLILGSSVAAVVLGMAPFLAFASTSGLSASCSGSASATAITWTAGSSGGVAPVSFIWSNGATTTSQTVSEAPGTYMMNLTATDASSTVATTSCSATVASSGTSVADQVKALLAQIQTIKQQIATLLQNATGGSTGTGSTGTTTPSLNGCPVLNRDVGEGDQGDDVRQLQLFLVVNDPAFATSSVTGFFGPLTLHSLKHFQLENGINSTGFVGPLTRGFFGKHCGEVEGEGHLKGTAHSSSSASTTPNGKHGENDNEDNATSSDRSGHND